MKEDSEARLLEEQMDFHVRSGFARPAERHMFESKTRADAKRRPEDGRVRREPDKWGKKRST